jgi:hypothetical protein
VSKQAFEQKIHEIEQLRSEPGPAAQAKLAKALANRSNYLVSKAAAVAADLQLDALIPDLAGAFERFLHEPVKTDPQCWAKIAIAKALKDLAHRDPAVFLRGITHVQMEPVFGGRQDTAGPVRSACALALVECRLDDFETLNVLAELLLDAEPGVRVDAAAAIAQCGSPAGALLLRLKARVGDTEPEVTGQCLFSLLSLGGADSVAFVGRFLDHNDPQMRVEAAAALGAARDPEALSLLTARFRRERDPELRHAMVTSAGASPIPDAAEFLLGVVGGEDAKLALAAVEALAASRFRNEVRDKVERVVGERGGSALSEVFARQFGGDG